MIVLDTSVLLDLLRGRDNPAVRRYEELEAEGADLWIPGICCQELLQGARDLTEWRRLEQYLSVQQLLFPADSWEAHRSAARIYFDCRRKGITLRGTVDCLIASLVIEAGGMLLHNDEDFEKMRSVCPLKTVALG
jgi:predicted nucleic acid-binding protein